MSRTRSSSTRRENCFLSSTSIPIIPMRAITLEPCGTVIISSCTNPMKKGLEDIRGSMTHTADGSRQLRKNATVDLTNFDSMSLTGLALSCAPTRAHSISKERSRGCHQSLIGRGPRLKGSRHKLRLSSQFQWHQFNSSSQRWTRKPLSKISKRK